MTVGNIAHDEDVDVDRMTRRPWRTPRLPELAGSKEATEILKIQKMTLSRWLAPGSGPHGPDKTYLITPARIQAGPVWVRADLERFRDEIGRQRAPAGEAKDSADR